MTPMNREVYDALLSADADETKAREAAKSVAKYASEIGEVKTSLSDIKASLRIIQWMFSFTLALVVPLTRQTFR